jgi:uroporphyrinogen decarboxylase
MNTQRERYLQTMRFEPADPPFLRWCGAWPETLDRWKTQGWDGITPLEDILQADTFYSVAPYYGPVPLFTYEVLEENDDTVVYVNHEGIVMREFKRYNWSSMPQFVRFPVENGADFDQLSAERLGLHPEERFTAEWRAHVAAAAASDRPRICSGGRWGGFFGPLRNLMGVENLGMAFLDAPALVERMMAQRADSMIEITAVVLEHTPLEGFIFWEDMAYNHASLVNPRLFRRLALPHYRRVCDWLRAHGVEHIWLDSDGNVSELIPIWLDAGIHALYPFEVQSGMDVAATRQQYGRDLVMLGGIDKKAVAAGGAVMRAEVDRVAPVVADGGYFPELDHAAPPDISWANMQEYYAYLRTRLARG